MRKVKRELWITVMWSVLSDTTGSKQASISKIRYVILMEVGLPLKASIPKIIWCLDNSVSE